MKGKFKTVLMMAIAVIIGSAGFLMSGCVNNSEHPSGPNNVSIRMWRSGIGDEFLNTAIAGFNASQSEYVVRMNPYASSSGTVSPFGQGGDVDGTDIYFAALTSVGDRKLTEQAEPLDDVLSHQNAGESKTIAQKMDPNFLSATESPASDKYDGKYYRMSYGGGWCGLVYNTDIINGTDFTVPVTSTELEELAIDLKAAGKTPFIHNKFTESDYWSYIYEVWAVQYGTKLGDEEQDGDGLDYYLNTFLTLTDRSKETPVVNSQAVLVKEDGRVKSLEALARIITPSYVYNGSNELTYIESQTLFLNDRAVMMPNGSWLVNEMKNNSSKQNLQMMKTPVISSIIDKTPSIGDEYELRAVIAAVDAATSAESVPLSGTGYSVTREDADRIWEARNLMYSNFDQHAIFIPEYSDAKDAAKAFLKYFFSDGNIKAMLAVAKQPFPFGTSDGSAVDMSGWMDFEKQQQAFSGTAIPIMLRTSSMSPIFTNGGALVYAKINIPNRFSTQNTSDRKDAATVWGEIVAKHNSEFANYRTNAQL